MADTPTSEALPLRGSTGSTVLGRCRCCGEWGKPVEGRTKTLCRWCGEPWSAVTMTGRPKPGAP